MSPPRALLLDLDGPVRLFRHDPAFERDAGLPPNAVRNAAFRPERLGPALTGLVRDEAWRAQVAADLRAQYPDADVERAVAQWSDGAAHTVDRDVLALVQRVRAVARVVLVTNATTRLPDDLRALGLLDAFDAVVSSAMAGACKPDPAIFRCALTLAGVAAEQALFVDDTAGHVAAAQALGLQAVLYTGAEALARALGAAGLL